MKYALVFVLLGCVASANSADAPVEEFRCTYIVAAENNGFRIVPSTTLRILGTVAEGAGFNLPADAPPSVTAVSCYRTSPVPSLDDKAVVDAGINLYISTLFVSGNPAVSLKKSEGKYIFEVTDGRLSRAHRKSAESVVAHMNGNIK